MRRGWKIAISTGVLVALFLTSSIVFVLAEEDYENPYPFGPFLLSDFERKLVSVTETDRKDAKRRVREMFDFGYMNYLKHAFPLDELDPIHCTGRGPDYDHPLNINVNDVLGGYSLTLVDSLTTLVVLGDREAFHDAVRKVMMTVSFHTNSTVQVFEATIRVLGSLLSAHMILTDEKSLMGDFRMKDYDGELLEMAHDLAVRLMPAFDGTATGLPKPRVRLDGLGGPAVESTWTCTAGAGSLLLEFGILSRLLGDETFERTARRVTTKLWTLRNPVTNLLGNVVDVETGEWVNPMSGLGAGADSFYEYLIKAHILLDVPADLALFQKASNAIKEHARRGRESCLRSLREPPIYVNVDMRDGSTMNTWVDSLQAAHPGVQVLNGELEEAICQHAIYYAIWRKHGVLPERFNWNIKKPDVRFYALRPEFAESTYFLYRSTGNRFYQHVGREVLDSLENRTRVECGYATVHDVQDFSLEDRMESFFLSETLKYLYLLFDETNPVNKNAERIVFSTEGHMFPVTSKLRNPSWKQDVEEELFYQATTGNATAPRGQWTRPKIDRDCESTASWPKGGPPLDEIRLKQIFQSIGFCEDDNC